jgi:hypothetical protein
VARIEEIAPIGRDLANLYDVLEVETRGFKGPRAYEETGLPLHIDNQSIFKERIYRDKADPNILHDEITSIDHALTQPWTVDKRYVHNPNLLAEWPEIYNTENNAQIVIGKEDYFLSGDGFLMPAGAGDGCAADHFQPRLYWWRNLLKLRTLGPATLASATGRVEM